MLRQTRAAGNGSSSRAASAPPPETRARGRRALWVLVSVAALAAASIVAALLVHDGRSNTQTTASADLQVRSFVYKLENFSCSRIDGRAQVTRAIASRAAPFDCSLTPDAAAALDSKEQAEPARAGGRLNVPGPEGALQASNLFQSNSRLTRGLDLP